MSSPGTADPAGFTPSAGCRSRKDSAKVAPLTNVSEDVTLARGDALIRMIDWLHSNKGLTREQAYAVAAAAVDLRIGQIVDVPNVIVSAVVPLEIFDR